jgi:hypothetical protein
MGITVWAAFSEEQIIGPYFFCAQRPPGLTGPFFAPCTVNSANYLEMLRTFFMPKFRELVDEDEWRFQQDGAPPHYANIVRDYLNQELDDRWIGRGVTNGNLAWPARSPDLTPLDFYLWGHVKDLVYGRKPTDYYQLMEFITEAFTQITPEIRRSVVRSIPKRFQNCINDGGAHQL